MDMETDKAMLKNVSIVEYQVGRAREMGITTFTVRNHTRSRLS